MIRLGFRAVADQVILQTERLRVVPLGVEHATELWSVYSDFPDDHLIAVINPYNTPSLRLAARLGFKPERSETVRDVQVVVHRLDLDR